MYRRKSDGVVTPQYAVTSMQEDITRKTKVSIESSM